MNLIVTIAKISFFILYTKIAMSANESNNRIEIKTCKIKPTEQHRQEKVCQQRIFSPDDTALVLVDFWYMQDEETNQQRKETLNFIDIFRNRGFYIINGIGRIAFRDPQYLKFRKEVRKFYGKDFCAPGTFNRSKNYKKAYGYRLLIGDCSEKLFDESVNEASRIIVPKISKKEYIVNFEDDFRYVLFKNKIKNLIYLGGAIDECILHRSYGINVLKGTDEHRTDINIYLASDFITSLTGAPESISEKEKTEILIRSLSYKIAEFFNAGDMVLK